MIHVKGDRKQPCLTTGLIRNQLLAAFSIITAAVLFSYVALFTLIYLSGIPCKGKTFAKALLLNNETEGLKVFDNAGTSQFLT